MNERSLSTERPLFGVLMALSASGFFGLITTVAKISYDAGSNATTASASRALFAILTGIILCTCLKRQWRIPLPAWKGTVWLAIGLAGMSIGYMGSVQFIPVSLAAVLFYTYPVCVLFAESVLLRQVPGLIRIITYAAAFAGLVLAIGPEFRSIDWRGLTLIAMAIVSASLMFFAARQARQYTNEIALMMWSNFISLPVIVAAMPFLGWVQLPQTNTGWIAFALVSIFFACAFTSYTTCLKYIAPARAAMFFNFEPLVSIIIALLLLGEILTTLQFAGAGLMLGALIVSAWRTQQKAGKTHPATGETRETFT